MQMQEGSPRLPPMWDRGCGWRSQVQHLKAVAQRAPLYWLPCRGPGCVSNVGLRPHPSRSWPLVILTCFFLRVAQFGDQRTHDDPVDLQDVLRQVELLDLVSRVVAPRFCRAGYNLLIAIDFRFRTGRVPH